MAAVRVPTTDTTGDDSKIASIYRCQCRYLALHLEYAGTEPVPHTGQRNSLCFFHVSRDSTSLLWTSSFRSVQASSIVSKDSYIAYLFAADLLFTLAVYITYRTGNEL